MARKKKDKELKILMANEHLFYEVQMFHESSRMIGNEFVQKSDFLRNSVIESFTIHTRNLLKFFFDNNPRNDDLIANDYYDNPTDWDKIKQKILKEESLYDIYKRVNKEVAHLSYERSNVDPATKGWLEPGGLAYKILSQAFQKFLESASEELIGEKLFQQKKNHQKNKKINTNFNWGKSIFPILSCEFDEKGKPKNQRFLGTGFFTIVEGLPLLISAKHVLGGFDKIKAEPCLTTRYGSSPALRLKGAITEHVKVDLAFMILDLDYFNQHKDEFVPIPIEYLDLPIGQDVFTLGYPHSQVVMDDFSQSPIVEIDQFFFKGYITNILDTTHQQGTSKSYLLNFPSMEGNSGSPLLATIGNRIICVGFLFKEKTISHVVDEKIIKIKGEEVKIPIYQSYNFGVACDASILLEAKNMLKDVQDSLKKKTKLEKLKEENPKKYKSKLSKPTKNKKTKKKKKK